VILGSAVYLGRWLEDARKLAQRIAADPPRPVWLFSVGPIGDPPKPAEEPAEVAALRETVHPIETVVFPGKLDRNELGFAEKAIVAVVHAPDGDFRTWEPVTAWASRIARTLETTLAEEALG
jgi:menaquinone-dependent protoporphyrinogen oxidase